MDLKQVSQEITDKFIALRTNDEHEKLRILKEMETTAEEMRKAAEQGDRSENAEYTAAVDKLSLLNIQISDVDERLSRMLQVDLEEEYVPIGMVVMYSTVRLEVEGKTYVYKVYPEGISEITQNILDKESRLGRAIWKKRVGDVVYLKHRITGAAVAHKIVDIY